MFGRCFGIWLELHFYFFWFSIMNSFSSCQYTFMEHVVHGKVMELKAHLIFCWRATYEIKLCMKLNCDNFKVTYRHFWLLPSQGVLNERKTWEFNVILFAATSSKSVQNCHLIRPWSTRNITFFLWHKSFIGVIICIAIRSCVYLKLQCFGTTSFAAGFFQQFLDYRHQYQHRNDGIAAAHIKPSPPRFRGHQSPHHHLNLNLEHFGAFWWILPSLSPNLVVSTMFSNEFRIIFTSLASRHPSFLTIVGLKQSGSAQHKNTQNLHTCIYKMLTH